MKCYGWPLSLPKICGCYWAAMDWPWKKKEWKNPKDRTGKF